MGFASPIISISDQVKLFSPQMFEFWNHLYHNILNEFCFVHKISIYPILDVTYEQINSLLPPLHNNVSTTNSNNKNDIFNDEKKIILPLGGNLIELNH